MRLEHPYYLLALAVIVLLAVLFVVLIKWKKTTARKMGDKALVSAITATFSSRRFFLKFLLAGLALACLITGLSNLRVPGKSQNLTRTGIDIMIAVDVSKSMLAEDIKPSRLDRARQLITRITDKLTNHRVGLVVFAGKAYLQMPVTADHSAIKLFVNAINTDAVPTQGTVISEALELCSNSFNAKEKKYKAILLISDGEDHDENANSVASQLAEQGIIIYTVGIGSPEGSPIILPSTGEYKKDKDGRTVITKLNEDILKQIAQNSGGSYQLLKTSEELSQSLVNQLNNMDQRVIADRSLIDYKSLYYWFAIAALFLLVVEFFITERKSIKKITPIVLLSLSAFFWPAATKAQQDRKYVIRGNEAYIKSDFPAAAGQYRMAKETNGIAQFNLGNALYRQQKFVEALAAWDNAIKNAEKPVQRSMAYYNKGVLFQNDNQLESCIAAYKDALRLNPGDEDARQNLQKALKKMQQQNPKPQKKKQKPNKPKEDKKKEPEKPKEDNKKQPKPQPSRISKQDAEEKLKSLQEKEKSAQEKMRKISVSTSTPPEKDW